jgi:Tfp pilus assembly protein PilX
MRRLRLKGEQGMVLPIALGILAVLSISVVVVIDSSTANSHAASRSKGDMNAFALAEAGINNAMSVLMKPGTNAVDRYIYCPESTVQPTLPCWNTSSYEGGSVQWTATLTTTSASAYWTMRAVATVRNPTGGTRPIQRILTARVPVYPAPSQPLSSPSWNYIYARNPGSGIAFSGCDMTVGNSVAIASPLYVNGNLCFANQATMLGSARELVVRGSLTFQNSSGGSVGSAASLIDQAHVAKGCDYKGTQRVPCVNGAPVAGSNVFATTLDANAGNVEAPNVLWNDWYLNANPGPYYPCLPPASGEPANPTWSFDPTVASGAASDAVKLTYRNNNAGLINLTPSASYTCKTFNGELSWNATTRVLTIRGTMFIDGSAKVDNGVTNSYTGQGVIYMSGTLLIKNSKLCGKLSGSNCTTSGWNPNEQLITFVVNGTGAGISPDNQVTNGTGAQIVSSHSQSAIYATANIEVGTTSLVDGPLDGGTVILGQTSNSAFPPFTIVPSGMPGNETIFSVVGNPEMFSG